ncbi:MULTISPECIES: PAS domain-containing sensor histidine kinase [unclassified Aureispira]|uniref:PAS domain-containing sensor histidine kinase n=1 Tax=unclassified Aureispira TaxID=2649989 RepID=UPI000698D855|nr:MULTISPECIES: PAS domain-containing sensor histidine kinase [unclassified Aureispira]WMX17430.1 PAS domain-containing sensor histidine kinase [Aureispira sp. CCB-E]
MKDKISLFIKSIQDCVIIINTRGIIVDSNPAIYKVLGFTPEELKGNNVSMLMGAPHQAKHDQYIQNHQATGIAKIIGIGREVIAVHKDGTKVPVRLNISELELDGHFFYVGMLHDLTNQLSIQNHINKVNLGLEEEVQMSNRALREAMEKMTQSKLSLEQEILERKIIQEQLLAAQEKIKDALQKERELSELKTRFISTASHEFRTPLSSILSSVSLIERYTTTETQDKRLKHINRIKSSVQNLTQILEDFLSLSKLEEGKKQDAKHIFDLSALIHATIEEVSTFAKSGQEIEYQHSGDISVIYSNTQNIKNILINLLSNAIKYSPSNSKIYISTIIDATTITISVRDKGIGIPLDQQKHLFSRFFRADNAIAIQGTGLGLYIVKKYLENINGTIDFVSQPGEGTTFTINIPKEDFQ